jgi:hypothetical protein
MNILGSRDGEAYQRVQGVRALEELGQLVLVVAEGVVCPLDPEGAQVAFTHLPDEQHEDGLDLAVVVVAGDVDGRPGRIGDFAGPSCSITGIGASLDTGSPSSHGCLASREGRLPNGNNSAQEFQRILGVAALQ